MSDEQVSAGNRSIVKTAYKSILGGLIKIYHYIAAENQVEFSLESNGIHQVEGPENYILLDGRRNGIRTTSVFYKIFLSPGRRERGHALIAIGGMNCRI